MSYQPLPKVLPVVRRLPWRSLPETELRDDRAVPLDVVFLQIGQQLFALAYHGHQRLFGAVVLLVLLEVPGKVVDPLCEQRDLAFSAAGVLLGTAVLGEDLLLGFCGQVHGLVKTGGKDSAFDRSAN